MKIVAHLDDGREVDVTLAVQVLYDGFMAVLNGSGFLSTEEKVAVEELQDAAGFVKEPLYVAYPDA